MHCVALTDDQQILTWGVNDDGALGRDTTWQAPTRDVNGGADEEDSDDEGDLSPKESTPTAIPRESFGALSGLFVQVVAADSASFALTSDGLVYGWGTFRVSSNPKIPLFYPTNTCTVQRRHPRLHHRRRSRS
jgi:regulator of chromosome condensation